MDRLTAITDVQVEGDGHAYKQSGSEQPFTFKTFKEEGDFIIKWFFPPIYDKKMSFHLVYTVKGALRFYSGGDQLWWVAVFPDRAYPVEESTVTVYLPEGAKAEKVASYGADATSEISPDGRVVTFRSQKPIYPNEQLEVRVQFPHGIVAGSPALWQRIEDMRPVMNLIFGTLGLFLAVAGILGTIALWYLKGRDVLVGEVASYLPEPPSDLPPGVAGTLLDEKADLQDIMATLVDLARRGAIEIVEKRGSLGGRKVIFRLKDQSLAKSPFETKLISAIFGKDRTERSLSELKDRFYAHIPKIQDELYKEAVNRGLFPANPEKVRRTYFLLGVGVLIIAGLVWFFSEFVSDFFYQFGAAICGIL
jgi:Predicted membrane protein (DUF2207).